MKRGAIALGVGAAIAGAGGGVLLWRLLATPPLPFPLERLPEETTQVESFDSDASYGVDLEMRPEDVPDEARWSNASIPCGGEDLFHGLLDPERVGGVEKLAELIANKEEAKATLSCGKAVAQGSPKKGRDYVVHLSAKHVPHLVSMGRFDGKDLPETTKLLRSAKAPEHLESARCLHDANEPDGSKPIPEESDPTEQGRDGARRHKRDPDADCAHAVAKLEREPLWLTGDMPGLTAFGDGYSPDGKNKIENGEQFEKLLGHLSGTMLAVGTGEDVSVLKYLHDDDVRDKTLRVVRDVNVWGVSVVYDGPFTKTHQEYHASKESDAKDIAEVLERFFKEQKRELKDDDENASSDSAPKGAPSKEDDPIPERDKLRAVVRKLAWHAVEDVVIDRSRAVVTVDMHMAPDQSDKAAWKAYADLNKARAKNAAAIIDALVAGNDPSEDDEKALSAKLHAALHPPESISLDGFGDFRIPGGGKCYALDEKTQSCAFPKWDKPVASEKVKATITKAGYTVTPGASDATLIATKGDTRVTVDVYGTPSHGSHVTLSREEASAH